ncbi:MAG: SigB/SigF/SigG family RNA polymerase sigma factor [Armatimonadetes bacterium]|nr:SigB/SigF/SigG family RNA polymerase sigma factor [Armatimonadota bacterium]MDI9587125.1 SigB/SigF/SigG family RNA polymerase sigma factor [Acidobacteriota bacterium]
MTPRWDNMSTNELFVELRRSGDPELRAYLIERHEGLVRHVARDYMSRGESYEDIVSVGHVGLIHAVDRFDPERGTKFATFAVPTIKGEMQRHFRDRTWGLRVPRRIQELSMQARKLSEELAQQLGRAPNYAELALELGVTEEDVIEAMEVGRQYELLSIEDGGSNEDGNNGLAAIDRAGEEDEALENIGARDEITKALRQLPPREQVIVVLRFFREMTQQEVGERLGISQMHVSRLQARALRRLRQIMSRER